MMKIRHGARQHKSGISTTGKPEKAYPVSIDLQTRLWMKHQPIYHALDINRTNQKGRDV